MTRILFFTLILLFALNASAQDKEFNKNLYEQTGDPTEAKATLDKLEGVYKQSHKSGYVGEDREFDVEDILEIVRVSDTTAYIKASLQFYNGHFCSPHGIAEYKKIGGFVWEHNEDYIEEKCYLTVKLIGDEVEISDPTYGCKRMTCGMRGSYGQKFNIKKRRKIRYMPIVLKSDHYKEALKEYADRKKSKND